MLFLLARLSVVSLERAIYRRFLRLFGIWCFLKTFKEGMTQRGVGVTRRVRTHTYQGGLASSGIFFGTSGEVGLTLSYHVYGGSYNFLRKYYKGRQVHYGQDLYSARGGQSMNYLFGVYLAYDSTYLSLFIYLVGDQGVGRYTKGGLHITYVIGHTFLGRLTGSCFGILVICVGALDAVYGLGFTGGVIVGDLFTRGYGGVIQVL